MPPGLPCCHALSHGRQVLAQRRDVPATGEIRQTKMSGQHQQHQQHQQHLDLRPEAHRSGSEGAGDDSTSHRRVRASSPGTDSLLHRADACLPQASAHIPIHPGAGMHSLSTIPLQYPHFYPNSFTSPRAPPPSQYTPVQGQHQQHIDPGRDAHSTLSLSSDPLSESSPPAALQVRSRVKISMKKVRKGLLTFTQLRCRGPWCRQLRSRCVRAGVR